MEWFRTGCIYAWHHFASWCCFWRAHGINPVSGALYPPAIRATGAGWALGLGRIGQIGGPLIGGTLLGFGWTAQAIFLAASVPAACVAAGMATLGWLRHKRGLAVTGHARA